MCYYIRRLEFSCRYGLILFKLLKPRFNFAFNNGSIFSIIMISRYRYPNGFLRPFCRFLRMLVAPSLSLFDSSYKTCNSVGIFFYIIFSEVIITYTPSLSLWCRISFSFPHLPYPCKKADEPGQYPSSLVSTPVWLVYQAL